MASVSEPRNAFTSPSSSTPKNRQWDYSVPVDVSMDLTETSTHGIATGSSKNTTPRRKGTGDGANYSADQNSRPRAADVSEFEPDAAIGNGTSSNPVRRSDESNEHLSAPQRPFAPQRQASNNSDEGDSVLDFYGSRVSSTSGGGYNEIYPNVNGSSTAMYDLTGDPDNAESSRWIHRDKLMRIEFQEHGGPSQEDRRTTTSNWKQNAINFSRKSGEDAIDDNDDDDDDEGDIYDLRLPEERAADRTPMRTARRVGSAGSYSRIPLSTASPVPIRQEYIERSTPLPRRQSNSPDYTDAELIRPRIRSKSLGSNAYMDSQSTPTPGGGGGAQNKHHRNLSQNKSSASPNTPRRPSSANRPGSNLSMSKGRSRSQPGSGRVPSTSGTPTPGTKQHHPPEGPPPWSLSTYSPDPKLPPDQQLIPTVAKRLQQEQWERDGVYASVYDRQLRPLKVHENEDDGQRTFPDFEGQDGEWPLKRDSHPPKAPTPKPSPKPPTFAPPLHPPKQEGGDLEGGQVSEKKKKKKGGCCGICAVM